MTTSSSITRLIVPEYGFYRDWAGEKLTVVPLKDKLPLGGITWAAAQGVKKKFVWQDDWSYAANGAGTNGGGLVLRNDQYNLCVVDVDCPDKIKAIRRWLREKLGQTYFVETKTRRGWHFWFKCHTDLKAGKSTKFGLSDNGQAGLDLLANKGQVPLPGSVWVKNGERGQYRWAGRFDGMEPTVDEFLDKMPIMFERVWEELRTFGKDKSKGTPDFTSEDIEVTDERFADCHRGMTKQECPVCGNNTLQTSTKFNGWMCFHSDCKGGNAFKVYEVVRKVEPQKDILDFLDEGAALPPGPVVDPLSQLQRAFLDMEAVWPQDRLAVELFPDGDPLAEWSDEALKAAELAAKLAVYDVPLRCKERGLGAIVATGKKLIKTETSCWSYGCETCGPILRKCLKISLVTAMARRGAEPSKVYVFEADYTDPKKFNDTVKKRLTKWARKAAKEAEDERDEELERPELPPFEWCAIQATPGTAYVMMWGEVDPDEIERSSPVSGTLIQMVDYVFNRVDQDVWDEHNKKLREEHEEKTGKTKHFRTVYMLAPRFMKGLVNDLKNFLTGRKRSGLENGRGLAKRVHEWDKDTDPNNCKSDKRKPGADFAFLPTYHVKAFIKYAEDKTMTSLNFQVDHATGFGSTQSARLPCKAAPLVREFVADNPHLHAHKKSKVAALALVDDDLDLYLGE